MEHLTFKLIWTKEFDGVWSLKEVDLTKKKHEWNKIE